MFVLLKERQEWEMGGERKEAFFRALPLCVFSPETHILWRNHTFLQGMAPHIERGVHTCVQAHTHARTHSYLRRLVNRSNVFSVLHNTCCSVFWHKGKKKVLKAGSLSLYGAVALSLIHHTHLCPETFHLENTDYQDIRCSGELTFWKRSFFSNTAEYSFFRWGWVPSHARTYVEYLCVFLNRSHGW